MINTCFTQNQKQNFEIVLKFKSDTTVLTCAFCFLFYPPLLLFLTPPPRFFPFLSRNLKGFVLVGKFFEKALNIIGLDRRKCRRVVDQDLWEFFGQLYMFLAFFSGLLNWITLILAWFKGFLSPAQVTWQSCPWTWWYHKGNKGLGSAPAATGCKESHCTAFPFGKM